MRSAASRRVLAVAISDGSGAGGVRAEMMVCSHVWEGAGSEREVSAVEIWAGRSIFGFPLSSANFGWFLLRPDLSCRCTLWLTGDR